MIVKLEFKLPEEEKELHQALAGTKALLALHQIQQFLRRRWKHDDPPTAGAGVETDFIFGEVQSTLDTYGIYLEEILD